MASSAVQAGADIVNDISGGAFDPELLPTVAGLGVPYVAMHVRGDLATMHAPSSSVSSTGAVATVASELAATARRALAAGVEPWSMILDPGVGFSKALAGNLQLLTSADDIRASMPGPLRRAPVLVGHSRKRFLGHITGKEAATDRDVASAAGCALAVQHGADIVRVHRVGTCLDGVLMGAAAAGFSRVFGEDSAFQRGLPR